MQNVMGFERNSGKSLYLVIDTETALHRDFSPMRTEIIELGWALVLDGNYPNEKEGITIEDN